MQLDIVRTSPNVNATLKSNLDNQFHAKCDLYPKPFDKNKTLKELSLPNIDPSLVILTGLSQGGFLGGKLVTRTPIRIERVVSGISRTLLIFGSNFLATSGTVIINGNKVYKVQKGIATWADSTIEISVDDDTLKSWRTIEVITTEATQARYEREAPYVDYTQPYDGAKNVPVEIKTILAVFNEPMRLETFTPDKFTLRTKDGSVTINGNVSYDIGKKTANFNF
jgi:Big-like domain-containing protein